METQNNRLILLINQKQHEVEFLQKDLQHVGKYCIFVALDVKMALQMATQREFPVIVAELTPDDITGSELLNLIKINSPEAQLILISEKGTVDQAVEAMKMGAFDFVTRPFSPSHLLQVVSRAKMYYDSLIENNRLRAEIRVLGMQKASGAPTNVSLKEAERILILKTLHECHGNKHLAAKRLQIPRSSLYSKIQKHGIRTLEKKSFYSIDTRDNLVHVRDIPA